VIAGVWRGGGSGVGAGPPEGTEGARRGGGGPGPAAKGEPEKYASAATVVPPPGPVPRPSRFDFLAPPRAEGELGRLDHYRVVKLLGSGGMGLVFLAEDTALGRPVALKVMRPELANDQDLCQRFLREARMTAAVKDDHIVTIHQVGQANGTVYLAMELLEGESLEDRLGRDPAPDVGFALRVGREVALGLASAHARGLVHRDIK